MVTGVQTCALPISTVLTTDLDTGATSAIAGAGEGPAMSIAVDSATNRAAVPTGCSSGTTIDTATSTLGIYDLAARTATAATFRGLSGAYVAFDPQHGLILVTQPIPFDVTTNNNSQSALLVFDVQGRLLASHESFNLLNFGLAFNQAHLQLDPAHRTGYFLGPLGQQLEPFSY